MAGVAALIMSVPEPPNGHGIPHEAYSSMQVGGYGMARHSDVLWLGWVLGLLVIGLVVGSSALGVQRYDRIGPLKKPLA